MHIMLITQEISFWSDSFFWNVFNDLEQKILVETQTGKNIIFKNIYIVLILYFCGSTKMLKLWKKT